MDVRLPDGTVIKNVPEGTTKAELVSKLNAKGYDTSWYKPEEQPSPQQVDVPTPSLSELETGQAPVDVEGAKQIGETAGDFAKGVGHGVTLGFSDELRGGVGTLAELISPTDPELAKKGLFDRFAAVPELYKTYRDLGREDIEATKERSPTAFTTGQIAGSLIPTTTALKGAQLVGTAARSGGLGATAQLGEMTDISSEDQWKDVAYSAALGSAAGLGGYGLGKGVEKIGDLTKYGGRYIDDLSKKLARTKTEELLGGTMEGVEIGDKLAQHVARKTSESIPSVVKLGKVIQERVTGMKNITGADVVLGLSGLALGGPEEAASLVLGKKTLGALGKVAGQTGMGLSTIKSSLDTISKYAPRIQEAVRQGTPFTAINNILMQTEPEYREAYKEIDQELKDQQ